MMLCMEKVNTCPSTNTYATDDPVNAGDPSGMCNCQAASTVAKKLVEDTVLPGSFDIASNVAIAAGEIALDTLGIDNTIFSIFGVMLLSLSISNLIITTEAVSSLAAACQ